ncbi:unnamed protein product, partial [Aphanomyces euteiches]
NTDVAPTSGLEAGIEACAPNDHVISVSDYFKRQAESRRGRRAGKNWKIVGSFTNYNESRDAVPAAVVYSLTRTGNCKLLANQASATIFIHGAWQELSEQQLTLSFNLALPQVKPAVN